MPFRPSLRIGTLGFWIASALAMPFARAESPPPALVPGDVAPAFKVKAHDGKTIELAKLRGQWVVLYFYPRDDTPGCTKEACSFRDNWPALKAAGIQVFGVSTDGNDAHAAFAKKYDLPFPLLPDENGKLAAAYYVPVVNNAARRITFLIDKKGKIAHVWDQVEVAEHARHILDKVSELDAQVKDKPKDNKK